jgi:hypothetical protein
MEPPEDIDDVLEYMASQGWSGPRRRPPLRCKQCGSTDVLWAYKRGDYWLHDTKTDAPHVCQSTPEGFDDVE